MNRKQLEEYIEETYSAEPEHPWAPETMHTVFRHSNNRKWFAVIMDIPKVKLGIKEDGMISIVNLKCDPVMTGSLLMEKGIHPAYHMNKANWVSAAFDGRAEEDKVKLLVELSFALTAKKVKRK